MPDQTSIIACALSLLPAPLQLYAAELLGSSKSLLELATDSTLTISIERRFAEAEEALSTAHTLGLKIVARSTPNYPSSLLHLPIPPALLFVKGSLTFLSEVKEKIAIVGARSASVTDCLFVSKIAQDLATEGVCVVSGLALGVDGAAHRGALSSNKTTSTVAVLAHGLDTIYPRSHTELGERILAHGGALISEYPPGTAPLRHHFLARNRIIAALVNTTIVAQAGARSGSLVTAQVALELGREVCVLSNPATQEVTEGSTKLIQDGALLVQSAREILTLHGEYHDTKKDEENVPPPHDTSNETNPVRKTPDKSSITLPLADLLRVSKYSLAYLLDLELQGEITRLPGNQVSIPSNLFEQLSTLSPTPTNEEHQ